MSSGWYIYYSTSRSLSKIIIIIVVTYIGNLVFKGRGWGVLGRKTLRYIFHLQHKKRKAPQGKLSEFKLTHILIQTKSFLWSIRTLFFDFQKRAGKTSPLPPCQFLKWVFKTIQDDNVEVDLVPEEFISSLQQKKATGW